MAVMNVLTTSDISHILHNNTLCINRHFSKNAVIKKSFFKWINLKYGSYLYRTLALTPWKAFAGFFDPHLPNAFLKSTFEEVWEKEYNLLNTTCQSRFRENTNVNQYLMRYWQLASSNFYPKNVLKNSCFYNLGKANLKIILSTIESQKKSVLVLNDGEVPNFEYVKEALITAFEKILPDKSSFEK